MNLNRKPPKNDAQNMYADESLKNNDKSIIM